MGLLFLLFFMARNRCHISNVGKEKKRGKMAEKVSMHVIREIGGGDT